MRVWKPLSFAAATIFIVFVIPVPHQHTHHSQHRSPPRSGPRGRPPLEADPPSPPKPIPESPNPVWHTI